MMGLETLGVLASMRESQGVFRPLFLQSSCQISASSMEALFRYNLGEVGSNRYRAEKRTLTHWRDLLIDLEGTGIF